MSFNQTEFILSKESLLTISGTSSAHDWEVVVSQFTGGLKIKENIVQYLRLEVPVANIKSERGPAMDNKMYKALKKEQHPEISFALRAINEESHLSGVLTIAGVSQNISIKGKVIQEANRVQLKGNHKLVLQDYNIEPPTAMFGQIVVGNEITIVFNLVFEKK